MLEPSTPTLGNVSLLPYSCMWRFYSGTLMPAMLELQIAEKMFLDNLWPHLDASNSREEIGIRSSNDVLTRVSKDWESRHALNHRKSSKGSTYTCENNDRVELLGQTLPWGNFIKISIWHHSYIIGGWLAIHLCCHYFLSQVLLQTQNQIEALEQVRTILDNLLCTDQ